MDPALKKKLIALSPVIYWKEILAIVMLLFAFIFFRSERKELLQIVPHLKQSSSSWLSAGFFITGVYILLQSGMYVMSFKAIGISLKWTNAVEIFLKRNLLSVFLPAGGVSSLAYTPSRLRKEGLNRTQTHQASGLYAFAGLSTIFIVGLPVIIFTLTGDNNFRDAWMGLLFVLILIVCILFFGRSLKKKGSAYSLIEKKIPKLVPHIDELFAPNVSSKKFARVILFSIGVELCGIIHIYIAMLALGLHPSFEAAAVGYIVSVLLMAVSPFLRGLGAVEIALVYILELYGYSSVQALSITVLYRVFEFWAPLLAGLIAFAMKGKQLFIRIAPAISIFFLGLINIISVVTPPLANRLKLTKEFIPPEAIHASNLLVLFIGVALLVTAAFLIKGHRNAWYIAILLSIVSLIGNLTKAFDYEEAIIAGSIIILLLFSSRQYRIKSSLKWVRLGVLSAVSVFAAVCIFGYISFYFIDVRHFGVDFTWKQSLIHTAKIFLLTSDDSLIPITRFGREFVSIIRVLGFTAWGFLLFTFIKPYLSATNKNDDVLRDRAKYLLSEFGSSAVDYFKTYKDKLLFFSDIHDAFMAYRIANGFAIVLEEPVCAEENKTDVLKEFEKHCRKMGLKPAFYRVDENSMPWFNELRKQKIFIGQEAILDLSVFTLEGKDKKSLRNGLNSLQKKGFVTGLLKSPHNDTIIKELKKVSDEWLESFEKKELIFSQGMFDADEIEKQDIILVRNTEGQIVAFLNIIPDFSPAECTYDLIRKTEEAPGGCMDALIIKLIEYAKENKFEYLNLGMVPMTGNVQPGSPAEHLMKMASEKLKRFRHFHSLRDFKEKYATIWQNKYLVYENDFDLLQLPAALNKVMQP